MELKTIRTTFGEFSFPDHHTVVATAHKGVEIDADKVQQAITLIEQTLPGDYAMILNRKEDYSFVPVEVYNYFGRLDRLKAIALVIYSDREVLPENMEQRLYKGKINKFNSIENAHDWVKELFKFDV